MGKPRLALMLLLLWRTVILALWLCSVNKKCLYWYWTIGNMTRAHRSVILGEWGHGTELSPESWYRGIFWVMVQRYPLSHGTEVSPESWYGGIFWVMVQRYLLSHGTKVSSKSWYRGISWVMVLIYLLSHGIDIYPDTWYIGISWVRVQMYLLSHGTEISLWSGYMGISWALNCTGMYARHCWGCYSRKSQSLAFPHMPSWWLR